VHNESGKSEEPIYAKGITRRMNIKEICTGYNGFSRYVINIGFIFGY